MFCCLVALFLCVFCVGFFYVYYNTNIKHQELEINVSIEYILFCLSETYQIDTCLLEPLTRNNFNKEHIKELLILLSNQQSKPSHVVTKLVHTYKISTDIAEKVVDFIIHQGNQEFPFSDSRMNEFIWKRSNIRDALSSIEDVTDENVNKSETFLYKVKNDDNLHIFNNLSQFKKSIKNIPLSLGSGQRCRMSFEVRGQPRTGKTQCSKYVLPYFCAKIINQRWKEKGLGQLSRAPVFYLVMEKNGNPIRALYNELKSRLAEIIHYYPEREIQNDGMLILKIHKCIRNYFKVYSDSHMFIVMDEIQLIDSRNLDMLKTTIKSRDFLKCTFILTGSTMSMFNSTLSNTCRNGLSYFDNTIIYDIPYSNSEVSIAETQTVLFNKGIVNRSSITPHEIITFKSYFTNLNVAYVSQILKYEHDYGLDFTSSVLKLIEEIFKIYERDLIDIEPNFILSILKGDLVSLEDTCFVTRVKNKLQLTDKLLASFLHSKFSITESNQVIKETKSIDHCLKYNLVEDKYKQGMKRNNNQIMHK